MKACDHSRAAGPDEPAPVGQLRCEAAFDAAATALANARGFGDANLKVPLARRGPVAAPRDLTQDAA